LINEQNSNDTNSTSSTDLKEDTILKLSNRFEALEIENSSTDESEIDCETIPKSSSRRRSRKRSSKPDSIEDHSLCLDTIGEDYTFSRENMSDNFEFRGEQKRARKLDRLTRKYSMCEFGSTKPLTNVPRMSKKSKYSIFASRFNGGGSDSHFFTHFRKFTSFLLFCHFFGDHFFARKGRCAPARAAVCVPI